MFSLYSLSKKEKIILSLLIFVIFYQVFILISSFYQSERIDSQIKIFGENNTSLENEIIDMKRKYIKSIIPSTQELLQKQNLGEVYSGERVIIIKNDPNKEEEPQENLFTDINGEKTNLDNLNYPEKWILFLTGFKF